MKKIYILIMMLILLISVSSCKKENIDNNINNQSQLDITMTNYIDSLIENTPGYIPAWNMEGFKGRWNYIDGVFLNSIVNLYYNLKDSNPSRANIYKEFFLNYIDYYIYEGIFVNPENQTSNYKSGELDSICESKILFDAYQMTNDSKYLKCINNTYNELFMMDIVDNSYNNFSHKETYLDQIWLDGMYMYVPFYLRYAISTGNIDIFYKVRLQYQFIREKMFDEKKGLYYHGYSSTGIFWSDNKPGCSKSFWLRSIGWYIVSLVDALDYYPEGDDKDYLISLLKEALDGILQYQDKNTKMFYQLVDKGNITVKVPANYLLNLYNNKYKIDGEFVDADISNYLESSGSSMISYALMKGSKNKYLGEEYLNKGKEIFEGIYNYSFKDNELNNICITAGLGPENKPIRDGSIYYYLAEPVGSNDAKGVGPFIMAYLEYSQNKTIKPITPKLDIARVEFFCDSKLYHSNSILVNSRAQFPKIPTKEGYVFDGWLLNGSRFNTLSNITQNTTLIANFKKIEE